MNSEDLNQNYKNVPTTDSSSAVRVVFFSIIMFIFGFIVCYIVLVAFIYNERDDEYVFSPIEVNEQLPEDLDYQAVEEIYDKLRKKYAKPLNEQQLIEGLKQGLVKATEDNYSIYIPVNEAEEYLESLKGEYVGIGIYINQEKGHTVVNKVIKNAPAEEAGLRVGDIILAVDGQSVADWSIDLISANIRGQAGTDVDLLIERGDYDDFNITLTRREVKLISVHYEIRDNIGIITIDNFIALDTIDLMLSTVDDLKQADVKGIVLDLRDNPGGDLNATSKVSSLWLSSNQRLADARRDDEIEVVIEPISINQTYDQALRNIPLVVIINEHSASASEMLAAALKDYGIGTIIGQTSFGKTTMQEVVDNFNQPGQGVLKVTTHHWHTPSGVEIKDGLTPEIIIEDDPETEAIDEQLQKALELLD